ncbi:flagellar protein FliT [Marinobacteraceae bacterium S3BR75-40.1]
MHEYVKAIKAKTDEVKDAARRKDWERLEALDGEIREPVQTAVDAAKRGEVDTAAVQEVIDQLLKAFEEARGVAVEARDEAEQKLKKSGKTQQAAKAYLNQAGSRKG